MTLGSVQYFVSRKTLIHHSLHWTVDFFGAFEEEEMMSKKIKYTQELINLTLNFYSFTFLRMCSKIGRILSQLQL
jgi:hypothetical protein